jgi:threonine/homoserine/homoserine lactone efflux protein
VLGGLGTSLAARAVAGSGALRVGGGALLCVLGVRTLLAAPPAANDAGAPRRSHLRAFASTLALTLTNPATVLSFAIVAAGLGVGASAHAQVVALAASVFAGSAAWWLLLSAAAASLRGRLSARALRAVGIGSGLVLIAFGVASLASG